MVFFSTKSFYLFDVKHLPNVIICLWTKNGEIQEWRRCIALKYDFYKGTRRMKLLDSNEIRQLRDVCIFEVNGIDMYKLILDV